MTSESAGTDAAGEGVVGERTPDVMSFISGPGVAEDGLRRTEGGLSESTTGSTMVGLPAPVEFEEAAFLRDSSTTRVNVAK